MCGVSVCVCVCVCITRYVSADDGVIIRLFKRLLLFHSELCYPLRRFLLQLTVSLFYLLTNIVLVSSIANV